MGSWIWRASAALSAPLFNARNNRPKLDTSFPTGLGYVGSIQATFEPGLDTPNQLITVNSCYLAPLFAPFTLFSSSPFSSTFPRGISLHFHPDVLLALHVRTSYTGLRLGLTDYPILSSVLWHFFWFARF